MPKTEGKALDLFCLEGTVNLEKPLNPGKALDLFRLERRILKSLLIHPFFVVSMAVRNINTSAALSSSPDPVLSSVGQEQEHCNFLTESGNLSTAGMSNSKPDPAISTV
ncbi:unnamed protein product, partial [Cyprideis torosa]